MKLSSRSDYATKAMLELSMSPERPITLAYLAHTQDISISYLEQIFALLRKHDLVRSVRGPGGGYVLNKPMNEISIGDIVKAIDFSLNKPKPMEDNQSAPESQHLWHHLSDLVYNYLSSVTIQDIHDKAQQEQEQEQQQQSSDSGFHAA